MIIRTYQKLVRDVEIELNGPIPEELMLIGKIWSVSVWISGCWIIQASTEEGALSHTFVWSGRNYRIGDCGYRPEETRGSESWRYLEKSNNLNLIPQQKQFKLNLSNLYNII